MKPENEKLNDFCDMNKFERLILKPASFMGLSPSTTDVVLTNHNQSFMKSHVYGAGISDHHKIIFSVLRNTLAKSKLETVFYRCYKKVWRKHFQGNTSNKILQPELPFKQFLRSFSPFKQIKIRYSNHLFMTKALRKVEIA